MRHCLLHYYASLGTEGYEQIINNFAATIRPKVLEPFVGLIFYKGFVLLEILQYFSLCVTEIYLGSMHFCVCEQIKISFSMGSLGICRSPYIGYCEFTNLGDIILSSFGKQFDSLAPLNACHALCGLFTSVNLHSIY